MARRDQRFTVYDMMDAKGVFSANPANADSSDPIEGTSLYHGPVEYPKMFYHPQGQERETAPGEVVTDPLHGARVLGRQTEIIWQFAASSEEETRLRAAGWHDHPAKALGAAGKPVPAISSNQRIEDLEGQVAKLQAEIDRAKVGGGGGKPPGRSGTVPGEVAAA